LAAPTSRADGGGLHLPVGTLVSVVPALEVFWTGQGKPKGVTACGQGRLQNSLSEPGSQNATPIAFGISVPLKFYWFGVLLSASRPYSGIWAPGQLRSIARRGHSGARVDAGLAQDWHGCRWPCVLAESIGFDLWQARSQTTTPLRTGQVGVTSGW